VRKLVLRRFESEEEKKEEAKKRLERRKDTKRSEGSSVWQIIPLFYILNRRVYLKKKTIEESRRTIEEGSSS